MTGTNYEILLNLDNSFIGLIKRGFIPTQYIDWKTYYEYFKWQKELGYKTKGAVERTCSRFNISPRQVYRVKAWMESIK